MRLIPGRGTKILHAMQYGQKKNKFFLIKKKINYQVLFIYISGKCKLTYTGRKQTSGAWEQGEGKEEPEGEITKGREETGGDGDGNQLDFGDGFLGVYICPNLLNSTH